MLAFNKKNPLLRKNNFQVMFPTNMLASLGIQNSFVFNVYIDDTANIICQIRHLFLNK